jgi:hypothetical protein
VGKDLKDDSDFQNEVKESWSDDMYDNDPFVPPTSTSKDDTVLKFEQLKNVTELNNSSNSFKTDPESKISRSPSLKSSPCPIKVV